jgi:RNA polymerase-binding transcription factor DksA
MDADDLAQHRPPDDVQNDPVAAVVPLDLDAIERDLADVEVALARLDAGTYWSDEVTGEPLSAELLAEHPTSRRSVNG